MDVPTTAKRTAAAAPNTLNKAPWYNGPLASKVQVCLGLPSYACERQRHGDRGWTGDDDGAYTRAVRDDGANLLGA